MGKSILDPLSEITQALGDIEANDGQARTYLAKCIDNLLHTEAKSDDELRDVLHEYLPVFDRLISFLPEDDTDTPYYRSIAVMSLSWCVRELTQGTSRIKKSKRN